MSALTRSIPAAVVSLSLVSPVFAHDEGAHAFEAPSLVDPSQQTLLPEVDCTKDPCINHFGKEEPHWHSSRKEDEEEEEKSTDSEA
jgi:hypothetical protein